MKLMFDQYRNIGQILLERWAPLGTTNKREYLSRGNWIYNKMTYKDETFTTGDIIRDGKKLTIMRIEFPYKGKT